VAIPIDKLPVIEAVDRDHRDPPGRALGVLYLDSRGAHERVFRARRQVLRTLAREAATVVENARLFAVVGAKRRGSIRIQIASEIQQRLLPKSLPDLPPARGG